MSDHNDTSPAADSVATKGRGIEGEEAAPEPTSWVAKQLAAIDAAGGDTTAATIMDRPIFVLIVRGRRTGKLRRVPLMLVEHDGVYAAVASKGGAPEHPQWYYSVVANPQVKVHVGTTLHEDYVARVAEGAEREQWWQRAVAAYPPYAEYQEKTDRQIPLFLLEPAG